MVKINIDGQDLEVNEGMTILEAARISNIKIPTLCYHEDQRIKSVCRICLVEIEGERLLQPSCSYPVREGMVIRTASPKVIHARRNVLELILARHPQECLTCSKNGKCELQDLTQELNMSRPIRYDFDRRPQPVDESSTSIVRDPSKCILCTRCVEACGDVQTISAIGKENRGFETIVVTPYGKDMKDTACVNCGQCVQVCPVGALTIKDDTNKIYDNMRAGKMLVAQVAPSVRTTIGEALGEEPGTVSTGRLVTAMKKLGFDRVFDSDFSADLTIMEEGYELLDRIQNGGVLPMITSCCPAWVKFCETYSPKYTSHLSTAKSPQQMFGSVIKTYFAQREGIDPAKICSISIMPCTAKKFECQREEMRDSGYQDVDISITVQELANMIREAGINFSELPETPFDDPFGLGSGAGEIFAATGGVMEAALRTVYEAATGQTLQKLDFHDVRGLDGIKESEVDLAGTIVRVAVAHGLGNAREIMRRVRKGTANYHFIEIMACPGGCIGGGGNPVRNWKKVKARTKSVYQQDLDLPIRKSHETEAIKKIYGEFLDKPLSERAHHLLHTSYLNRQDLLR